jgi:tetratricopeptide (TPR) repeat protein
LLAAARAGFILKTVKNASLLHNRPARWCGVVVFVSLALATAAGKGEETRVGLPGDSGLGEEIRPPDPMSGAGRRRAVAMAGFHAALLAEAEGDQRKALEYYRKLMASGGAPVEVMRRAVVVLERFGNQGEARAAIESAAALTPGDPAPRLLLVEYLDTYGERAADEGAAIMAGLEQRFPAHLDVVEAAARRHLVADRREDAGALLEAARERSWSAAEFLRLGRLSLEVWPQGAGETETGTRDRVNFWFERALEAAEKAGDRESEIEVARYYLLSNQLDRARGLCERLAARDGDLLARKILHRLYESMDLREKAFAMLEGIVRDDPGDTSQRRLLAEQLEQRNRHEEAAVQIEALIKAGGGAEGDYDRAVQLWLGLRRPDRALTLLQRAARLFPASAGFQAQLALAHSALNQHQPAVAAFRKAEELAETGGETSFNHRFYFRFGSVLERAGMHDEAARQFAKSIELTPESDPEELGKTLNYLGYMLLEQDREIDKAGDLIRRAVQIEPENPAYLDSLGWFYHKSGRHQEALVELLKARALIPEPEAADAEIFLHIALAYEALNDLEAARAALAEAAALGTDDPKVISMIEDAVKRLGAPR